MISEMVASHAMLSGIRKEMYKLFDLSSEIPIGLQIAGWDPYMMAEAAQMTEQLGVSLIDINMGCPAKKVTGKAGPALMREPDLVKRICDAVVRAVSLPVTLKTRLGWDDVFLNAPEIAQIAEQAGVKLVTIHGRTRCQMYKGQADWSAVKAVVDAVQIPVFVNGDINSCETAKAALSFSGAAGVMVGRSVMGQPWLLAQIADYISGQPVRLVPSTLERHMMMQDHLSDIIAESGVRGLRAARKHFASYCAQLEGSDELKAVALQTASASELKDAIFKYFMESSRLTAA